MVFDTNSKNTTPMFLATVHGGKITYRPASMEKKPVVAQQEAPQDAAPSAAPVPYARVGEDGVTYNGPAVKDTKPAVVKIAVFGPNAEEAVHSPEALHAVQLARKQRPAYIAHRHLQRCVLGQILFPIGQRDLLAARPRNHRSRSQLQPLR